MKAPISTFTSRHYLDTVLKGHCKGQLALKIIAKPPVRDCEKFAEGSFGALVSTHLDIYLVPVDLFLARSMNYEVVYSIQRISFVQLHSSHDNHSCAAACDVCLRLDVVMFDC